MPTMKENGTVRVVKAIHWLPKFERDTRCQLQPGSEECKKKISQGACPGDERKPNKVHCTSIYIENQGNTKIIFQGKKKT